MINGMLSMRRGWSPTASWQLLGCAVYQGSRKAPAQLPKASRSVLLNPHMTGHVSLVPIAVRHPQFTEGTSGEQVSWERDPKQSLVFMRF